MGWESCDVFRFELWYIIQMSLISKTVTHRAISSKCWPHWIISTAPLIPENNLEFFLTSAAILKNAFHCVNTSYLPDDSYMPAPAGPAKRKKKTSWVSPPAGPVHYTPLARWPSSCLTRQRDVTS